MMKATEQAMRAFTASPPLPERPGGARSRFDRSILPRPRRNGCELCGRTGAGARRRLAEIAGAEIVAADQSVQGGAAHRQKARGLGDVAARLDERFDESAPLGPVARFPERRWGPILDLDAEVAGLHELAAGHQDRPLDRVLELADVARPGVMRDRLECRAAEAELAPVGLAGALQDRVGDEDD